MKLKAAVLIKQAGSHEFSKDFDHRNRITTMQNVFDDRYSCRTLLGG